MLPLPARRRSVSRDLPNLFAYPCAFLSPQMQSLFRKKSTTAPQPSPSQTNPPASPPPRLQSPTSPDKKSKGYFVKEREKDKRPKSPRTSKSYARPRRPSDTEHPLNYHPDDPRRLSALSAMSSPPENGGVGLNSDPMETTPAPETPGAFPQTNGVNGEHHDEEEAVPVPPPHRTPASPPPASEKAAVDAEACKAAGNKFYKAKQYEKAIQEYSKGWCMFLRQKTLL